MTSDFQMGYDAGYEDATNYLVEYHKQSETNWLKYESDLLDEIDRLRTQVESMDWLRATAQRKYEETLEQLIIERERNG